MHYVDMRYVRENGSTIMFRCYVKTGNATVKAYDTVHRVSLTGRGAVQYAAKFLDKDQWPQFAQYLFDRHMTNELQDSFQF